MKKRSTRLLFITTAYLSAVCLFLFLLFINFYPVRSRFEAAVLESTQIFDRNGVLLYETLHPQQGKTSRALLSDISPYLIKATIAAEDASFYTNSGVDFAGIARAVVLNVKSGRIISGGSTITQQLVRNVIGTNAKRTIFQKMKESFLAVRLTKVFTKDEILELYLNKVYYGNLNYGIAAASRGYFGKEASDLDLAESAFLAGLPQAPNRYDPFEHRADALARKDYVLSLMRKNGEISEDDFLEALKRELVFEDNLVTVRAPHFVQYVIEELENRFGPEFVTAGLRVHTTLDYNLQQKTQDAAKRTLELLAGRNVTNASVVVLDPKTAEIRVMLGSIDYFDDSIEGKVNIALRPRQPGSALKPITYAVAFEKGWNGATLVEDEPVRFFTAEGTPYFPKNYDFEYHGTVSVRSALANSYNIPAVHAIQFAGVDTVLQKARSLGLSTLTQSADHYGLALTLGDGEVRLIDLASAYMVFANEGLKKNPQAIIEVRGSSGAVRYAQPLESGESGMRVLDEDIAFMITDILSDNDARLPEFGYGNVLELSGRRAAVKTGTTRNFRDNWALGYTPHFVVGVWVGNSDNSPMRQISGVYGAGPLWRDVMEEAHRDFPDDFFKPPATLVRKEFCLDPAQNMDSVPCGKKTSEWTSTMLQNFGVVSTEDEKEPFIKIKKPFDLDTFKLSATTPLETQQIKLQVEKTPSVGEVQWVVRGSRDAENEWRIIGIGDEMFWQLQKGEWEIQARAADGIQSEPVKIFVE